MNRPAETAQAGDEEDEEGGFEGGHVSQPCFFRESFYLLCGIQQIGKYLAFDYIK